MALIAITLLLGQARRRVAWPITRLRHASGTIVPALLLGAPWRPIAHCMTRHSSGHGSKDR